MTSRDIVLGSGIGFSLYCWIGVFDIISFNTIRPWHYILAILTFVGISILLLTYVDIINFRYDVVSFATSILLVSLSEILTRSLINQTVQEVSLSQLLFVSIIYTVVTIYAYKYMQLKKRTI